jgi:hypothetical protein
MPCPCYLLSAPQSWLVGLLVELSTKPSNALCFGSLGLEVGFLDCSSFVDKK